MSETATTACTKVGISQLHAVSNTNCHLVPSSPRKMPPGFSTHSNTQTITVTSMEITAPTARPNSGKLLRIKLLILAPLPNTIGCRPVGDSSKGSLHFINECSAQSLTLCFVPQGCVCWINTRLSPDAYFKTHSTWRMFSKTLHAGSPRSPSCSNASSRRSSSFALRGCERELVLVCGNTIP